MEGSLANRYRQYKAGTTKVVDWIAQTARRSGDITSVLPSLRDANNAAKRAKTKKLVPPSDTTVRVTTQQLLHLTHLIVEAALPVPDDIIRTIRAVIAAREECSSWYASRLSDASDGTATKNDSHQHFIHVLKEIARMLEHSKKPKAASKGNSKSTKSSNPPVSNPTDSLTNTFALLQIEETASNPLGTAPAAATKKPPPVTFEMKGDSDSKDFAIWCFLQDCRDLRSELHDVWSDYKNGKISLNVAGMVTETSVFLVQHAEAELSVEYSDLGSHRSLLHWQLLEHVGFEIVENDTGTFAFPLKKAWGLHGSTDRTKLLGEELVDLLCPRAFSLLRKFQNIMASADSVGKVAIPWYSGTGPYFDQDDFDRYVESLLPSFKRLCRERPAETCMQSLLHLPFLALAILPCQRICTWHVVALQISIDIFNIVGLEKSSVEVGLFKSALEKNQAVLRFHRQELERDLGDSDTDLSYAGEIEECKKREKTLENMLKDPFATPAQVTGTILDTQPQTESSEKDLPSYRGFPAIPGRLVHLTTSWTNRIGRLHCNGSAVLLSTAYLYRAALNQGIVKNVWKDMEFVITNQSRTAPFVLEPIDGIGSMYKCFGIALGPKPSAYSKGQFPHVPNMTWVYQHGKSVQTFAPFVTTYRDSEARMPSSRPTHETMAVRVALDSVKRLEKSVSKSQRLNGLIQQYEGTGKLTIAQLTYAFKEVLIEDDIELKFDYFELSRQCFDILGAVIDLRDDLPSTPHESVYCILLDAAKGQRAGTSVRNSLLAEAGRIIERHVQEKGTLLSDLVEKETIRPTERDESRTQRQDKMSSVLDLIGLPTTHSMRVGQFCRAKHEYALRSATREAFAAWQCSPAQSNVNMLHEPVIAVMLWNRRHMTMEDRKEMAALLAEVIAAEDADVRTKKWLTKLGIRLEDLREFMLGVGE